MSEPERKVAYRVGDTDVHVPVVGDKLRLYGHSYPNRWGFVTHHVRAVLLEDEQVVLRRWSKAKQHWLYQCESFYAFELMKRRDGLNPKQEEAERKARNA